MKKINSIFHSLQGEGRNTGRAAAFVRFAMCNLRCPFCDTSFDTYREMSDEQIMTALAPYPTRFVVLTGGEPTLQVDEAFVALLHDHGYEVAMESNGILPAPRNLDWLTVSTKDWHLTGNVQRTDDGRRLPDEVKIVFDEQTPGRLSSLHVPPSALLYLQPCDTGDPQRNAAITRLCVEYIKQHPQWRLSLQTHKLINIE